MVYGIGTRSYNRSTQREATEKHLAAPKQEYIVYPLCTCDGKPYLHQAHPRIEFEKFRPWRRWQDREDLKWMARKSCGGNNG